MAGRICDFAFSDGAECLKPAVANISVWWYCAEHYDTWIDYYRRHFAANGEKFDERILKAHR